MIDTKNKDHSHDALKALTSAALLIPMSTSADAPPDASSVAYRYSFYQEDDLAGNNVAQLSTTERYEIDVHQFQLLLPVGSDYSVKADIQYETMSGASPWQTQRDSLGVPRLIMSGASIEDTRTDLGVQVNRHEDDGKWSASLQFSDEDDYRSFALGLGREWDTNDKHRTYSIGLSYSDDELEPTQGTTPTNTLKDDKNSLSAYVGVSQIINSSSIVRASFAYTQHDGYLTDPYKFNDRRPDTRDQFTLSAGYRKFLEPLNAALHIDYRFFDDSWGVDSHTLSAAWHQNLGVAWQLVPSIRYYSQSQASFFGNEAAERAGDTYFSDDFRLSTYGAVSFGMKVNYSIERWMLTASAERYASYGDRGLNSVAEEAPALLEFTRYTVGFNYRF